MKKLVPIVLMLVMLVMTAPAFAVTIVRNADLGCTIRDDSDNTVSGSANLYMGELDWPDGAGSVLYWNLSALSGTVVGNATLTAKVSHKANGATFGVYQIYDDNADWATPGKRIDYWNRDQLVNKSPSNPGNGDPWLDNSGVAVGTYRGAINAATPLSTVLTTPLVIGGLASWTIPASVVQSWIDTPAANAGVMITQTVKNASGLYLYGITSSQTKPYLSFELAVVGDLIIQKYWDKMGDGSIVGDPLLGGWTFSVNGPGLNGAVTDNLGLDTDPTAGIIKLAGLAVGNYTVTEQFPPPWSQWYATYDSDGLVGGLGTAVGVVVGGQTTTVKFGNTIPEPAGLGLVGLALLALRKRRS